jgi:hypothetical protein
MSEIIKGTIEIVREGSRLFIRIGEVVVNFIKALVSVDMIEMIKGFFEGSTIAVISWFNTNLTPEEIDKIRQEFKKKTPAEKAAMIKTGMYKLLSFEDDKPVTATA